MSSELTSFMDPRPYVAGAAKGLDQLWPGWERSIDTDALEMRSCALCVLGQIEVTEGSDYLWMEAYRKAWAFIIENQLCSSSHPIEGVFSDNIVRKQWIIEIEARLVRWQEDLDASRATLVHG